MDLARQLVELGYRGSGEILRRNEFELRKEAIEKAKMQKLQKQPKTLASAGKVVADAPLLQALSQREEAVRGGKLTTIIFIRDMNAKGQEVSGYIDFAHRLKTENMEPIFERRRRLLPKASDLSFYNWETQTSTSNPTPNFQVIADNEAGLLFKNKRDRKIINVDPQSDPGNNSVRTEVVLGFALDRAGRPSPPLEARVREGVQLLQAGRVDRLVFSGGHPGGGLRGGVSEAEVMKGFAEEALAGALPRGAAVLEKRSTSTRENALFSLVALAEGGGGGSGVGEVVVVTSCFHQWRARRAFLRAAQQLNLPAQVTVAPLGPDSDFGFSRAFEQTLRRALPRGEAWEGASGWLKAPLLPAAAVLDACAALFHVARELLAIVLYFSKGWV